MAMSNDESCGEEGGMVDQTAAIECTKKNELNERNKSCANAPDEPKSPSKDFKLLEIKSEPSSDSCVSKDAKDMAATNKTSKNIKSTFNPAFSNNNELPRLPYVTTSDVVRQLNENMQKLEDYFPGDPSATNNNNNNNSSNGLDNLATRPLTPHVELHKRLPDGSTIPASQADMAASDLQHKLQQSAHLLTLLESRQEQYEWAQEQRQVGNKYFAYGDYKSAMDIYMTCLLVKDICKTKKQTLDNDADTANVQQHDQVEYSEERFYVEVFLPVLNNLAQCTLQLSMHKKTIAFCTMAIEEVDGTKNSQDTAQKQFHHYKLDTTMCSEETHISIAKLYYKRGKAQRLTGEYASSRQDFCASLQLLEQVQRRQDEKESSAMTNDDTDTTRSSNSSPNYQVYVQAIQKELKHLDVAEREGRKNRQRQRRAMQQVLGSSSSSSPTVTVGTKATTDSNVAIYDSSTQGPRTYSRLRSRARRGLDEEKDSTSANMELKESKHIKHVQSELSYVQQYCLIIARVAKILLEWTGDEKDEHEVRNRNDPGNHGNRNRTGTANHTR